MGTAKDVHVADVRLSIRVEQRITDFYLVADVIAEGKDEAGRSKQVVFEWAEYANLHRINNDTLGGLVQTLGIGITQKLMRELAVNPSEPAGKELAKLVGRLKT